MFEARETHDPGHLPGRHVVPLFRKSVTMRAIGNHMASHGGGQLVPQAGSTRAHATFDPNGRSVSEARRFVRDTLVNWDVEEVVDDAVLLVSELDRKSVV